MLLPAPYSQLNSGQQPHTSVSEGIRRGRRGGGERREGGKGREAGEQLG